MPLSPDQRAMLELLLERGQGYADLGSLLDLAEPEVRARARAALTELGGADPDRNVGLTDYLLGQADPIGRADAARHLKEDPSDHRLASELITRLREVAPAAQLPKLPAAPGEGRFLRRTPGVAQPAEAPSPAVGPAPGAPAGRPPRLGGRLSELDTRQTRLLVGLASAAVILIAVVLAISGAFGGDDEEPTAASETPTTPTTDEDFERVELRPSDGGDAAGSATFGIVNDQQPYVDLEISNLEPAPRGEAYVLWLLLSEDQGHPLQPFQVNQDGTFNDRIPIQAFLSELAARTQIVDISLSEQRPLLQQVEEAVTSDPPSPIIGYTGDSVLRGEIQQAR